MLTAKKLILFSAVSCLMTSYLVLPQVSAEEFSHLPPLKPWSGQSEKLLDREKSELTPAERTGLSASPSFGETIAYIHKMAGGSPYLRLKSIGDSQQNHPIFMVIANTEGQRDAKDITENGKPTILIQAGIHSGEIDGKDAGLMLLRDIVSGKELELIQKVNILFIPVLSADGHNRMSEYNRVNQRGPEVMGWRTNSQNLNLNRDYAKLQTPAVAAVVKVINEYKPDLYVDIHVTDGEDYQYDITYGYNPAFATDSPAISKWLTDTLQPRVDKDLAASGHIPGPLVFAWNKKDFAQGIAGWVASPRYSNGYGDTIHLPTILVENHSLKPYRQRVLGTYVLVKSMIELLADDHKNLKSLISQDKARRPKTMVLERQYAQQPDHISFKGIAYEKFESEITGIQEVRWLGTDKHYDKLPIYWQKVPKVEVEIPKAYIVPKQYQYVIDRLAMHGVEMTPVSKDQYRKAANYHQFRITEHKFADKPFEGQTRVTAKVVLEEVVRKAPKDSMIVSTNQDLGRLVVALLDPRGPDSFFAWGYFNSIFQRTEYIESYAVLPLAQAMMDEDPKLKAQFERKLKEDADFAKDPRARLDFFYTRSLYYDKTYKQYPVLVVK